MEGSSGELDADGGLGFKAKLIASEAGEEIGLANAGVADQHHLEQVIVLLVRSPSHFFFLSFFTFILIFLFWSFFFRFFWLFGLLNSYIVHFFGLLFHVSPRKILYLFIYLLFYYCQTFIFIFFSVVRNMSLIF